MMTPIENRLRFSAGMDAVNGNQFERSVCSSQMMEAANEITNLRLEYSRLTEDKRELMEALDRLIIERSQGLASLKSWEVARATLDRIKKREVKGE